MRHLIAISTEPSIIFAMPIVLDPTEKALRRGIKTVGVGKKGSKALTPDLAQEIIADIQSGSAHPAAIGAFFAGLVNKGVEGQEYVLEQVFSPGVFSDLPRLVEAIAPDAPADIKTVCLRLLNQETLTVDGARDLGRFLFSESKGDGARGLVASLLRVRYETDDEYQGLWQAMQETLSPSFKSPLPDGAPVVQLAEPFDGNDHSFLITPLVGQFLQDQGFRVIHMVGRNSGPKLVMNLYDVIENLDVSFARSNQDLMNVQPKFGWFLDQKDLSPAMDRWVDIRHQTIKRPFLATLEKFIKPVPAQIMISSAFHPPYGEKMTTISERCGFPGVMVVRNGIEGSMAFSLKRPAKILLSARQKDGSYLRHEIIFDVEKFLGTTPLTEEARECLDAKTNARLIKSYVDQGTSGDEWFDLRVKVTCAGFAQGLGWLKENIYDVG